MQLRKGCCVPEKHLQSISNKSVTGDSQSYDAQLPIEETYALGNA